MVGELRHHHVGQQADGRDMRAAAPVSALFIFCNSIAALAGHWSAADYFSRGIGLLALMEVMRGWFGAQLDNRLLTPRQIQMLLGAVLILASLKLPLLV